MAAALTALVACSSTAERSTSLGSESADQHAAPELPTPSACLPDVSGLEPSTIAPIEIACPQGYLKRGSFAALPTAGRFTSLPELTAAFCVEASDSRAPTASAPQQPFFGPEADNGIDFETSDVVVYAFDARSGIAPALFQRGRELWLRVTTMTCNGGAPDLESIAFVVPKATMINDQRCTRSCR